MSMVLDETDHGGKVKMKKKISDVGGDIEEGLKQELDEWWQAVLNDAILLCPVESGALQSSIRIESTSYAPSQYQAVGETGNELIDSIIVAGGSETNKNGIPCSEYALAVHDGHVTSNGKGWVTGEMFLANALMIHEEELMEILSKATDKKLNEVTEE